MSTLTIVVKKHKLLYENEKKLNDSSLEKRLETCKGIIKSHIKLVEENINSENKILIGEFDNDRVYIEDKLIKIYMHKSTTYYYVYEFSYVLGEGFKYLRDMEVNCGKVL